MHSNYFISSRIATNTPQIGIFLHQILVYEEDIVSIMDSFQDIVSMIDSFDSILYKLHNLAILGLCVK